jgi:hypothetical protein
LCIAIFFKGGGRYSVDRLIGREFGRKPGEISMP